MQDIANVEAYHRMGLTYADLCDPVWMRRDPEVFYGFWGKCFNDYMVSLDALNVQLKMFEKLYCQCFLCRIPQVQECRPPEKYLLPAILPEVIVRCSH